jgi:hypothetical protein
MKRTSLTLFVLMLAVEPSLAVERLNTDSTTCAAAQQTVARDGAVILRYPSQRVPGMTLYKRYVRSKLQCDSDDRTVLTSVKTADDLRCKLAQCQSITHKESTTSAH